MKYLPKNVGCRDWHLPKRERCVILRETRRTELSKPFDTRHRTMGLGVYHTGFQTLVQWFLAMLISLFWMAMCLLCNMFQILQDVTI